MSLADEEQNEDESDSPADQKNVVESPSLARLVVKAYDWRPKGKTEMIQRLEKAEGVCAVHFSWDRANGYTAALRQHVPERRFEYFAVSLPIGFRVFVLDDPEAFKSALKKELDYRPPEAKPTPRKVLVKMASRLLRNARAAVSSHNGYVEQWSSAHSHTYGFKPVSLPDLDAVAAVRTFAGAIGPRDMTGQTGWQQVRAEMLAFCEKPGVDDSVVREAWNLSAAQEVLES